MRSKLIEIRDDCTCINAMATKLEPSMIASEGSPEWSLYVYRAEASILHRAGFYGNTDYIVLTQFPNLRSEYDPYRWDNKTMGIAHLFLRDHFDEITDGWVVDVRLLDADSGTTTMCIPERYELSERQSIRCKLNCTDYDYCSVIDMLRLKYALDINIISTPEDAPGLVVIEVSFESISRLGCLVYELIPTYLIPLD